MLNKEPNDKVEKHDIFKEYSQKIKSKSDKEFWNKVLEIEKEKLYYFMLAYPQKIVTVKTGEKDAEKQFLGYKFSDRRGSEGIHAIQRGKSIDECTHLFDMNTFDNPQKASTYIYRAFNGDTTSEIDDSLKDNISRVNLLDMLTFDRVDFEKVINVKAKKKIKIESKYPIVTLDYVCKEIFAGGDLPKDAWCKDATTKFNIPIYSNGIEEKALYGYTNIARVNENALSISARGTIGYSALRRAPFYPIVRLIIAIPNPNIINLRYLYEISKYLNFTKSGKTTPQLTVPMVKPTKLPLPPLDIQQKIVDEIEKIEHKREKLIYKIRKTNDKIHELLNNLYISATRKIRLGDTSIFELSIGKRVLNSDLIEGGEYPVYSANVFEPFGYVNNLLINKFDKPSVIWGIDGEWATNIIPSNIPFYPTDHCGIVKILKEQFILEKYLAFALNKEGKQFGFSRTKRASIDRVMGITIPVPPLSEQQKIIAQIEELEKQITEAQAIIDNSKQQKQEILDKYLK